MSDARLEQEAVSAGKRVRDFLRLTRQEERAARLDQKLGFSRHARVAVVVAGECDTGRASLVNALVGCPTLLPVGTEDRADTCWTVQYGEPELATAADVGEVSQAGAAQAMSVFVDSPLLARDRTLIYTPDLGGPAEAVAMRATWDHAEVLVLTVDPSSSPSPTEIRFVETVSPMVGTVIVVLTKIDLVPDWHRQVRIYEQMLRVRAAPTTWIRVVGVSSEWKAEAGRLRSRGEDAEADRRDEESGFGALEAEIERLVSRRRWLRSRAVVHACHVYLGELRDIEDGHDPASEGDGELVARLRRQLDQLRSFIDERPALLAGFDEELAELSDEIRGTVERRQPELERHARGIDVTAVDAQRDLGYQLNEVLADVKGALDDLCGTYQQRAVQQVLESLREHGFEMMVATQDPAITRPDAARINPKFAPREGSLSDVLLGAFHIVERVLGAHPDVPDEGSSRGLVLAGRPAVGALMHFALNVARSNPVAAVVAGAMIGGLLGAGAREARSEWDRQFLRLQVDEASRSLAGYPARYQEQIKRYATLVWKELEATAGRLADHTAEKLAIAEQALDAAHRLREEGDRLAELSRFNGDALMHNIQLLLAEFDADAA